MKLNSKGQVTIPAELRHRHGIVEGDEVDVVEDGNTLRIVHRSEGESRGERVVSRMRNHRHDSLVHRRVDGVAAWRLRRPCGRRSSTPT